MIKLTNTSNGAYYFNPDLITSVRKDYENPSVTVVVCDGVGDLVTESPEEVTRKILEYKLAMQQQKVAYELALNEDCMADKFQIRNMLDTHLRQLAGLEE